MNKIERQHAKEVDTIRTRVRSFYDKKQKVKIYHAGTNLTRSLNFDPTKVVDVSKLNHVLRVNKKQSYALVEPNIPMDMLVEETLKFGLIPPVVMEFPGITVGGGIQGGAGESSSFRYGLFNNICLEYEMVMGDGQKMIASPNQNTDLFNGMPCSYGSIGVITAVKLQLLPAHNYVRLHYIPVKSYADAVSTIQTQVKLLPNFIDAIMFSKDFGVVMSGMFADKGDLPLTTFHRASDEWFYLHARKVISKQDNYEELIPLKDYLFRYDRGAFWTGHFGFTLLKVPFNRATRFIMSRALKTRTLYKFLHASNLAQQYLVQDIALPAHKTQEFMEFVDKKFGIYPIWLCPLKPDKKEKLSGTYLDSKLIISVGVYGEASKVYAEFVKQNRLLERQVVKLGGRKWLYAYSYYSQEEFWRIYDKSYYDKLRTKYHANEVFPNLYDKIVVKQGAQPSIMAGFMGLIKSPFRLKN